MTTSSPLGRDANSAAAMARNLRATWCLTTEPPTCRLTTKPTRVGSSEAPGATWSTKVGRPARRPDRTTWENSRLRRIRCAAGSTASSGGETGAALAAPRRDDRPASASAHPQAKTVGFGPTAVVGLERTLGHLRLRTDWGRKSGTNDNGWADRPPPDAGARGRRHAADSDLVDLQTSVMREPVNQLADSPPTVHRHHAPWSNWCWMASGDW